MFCPKNVDFVIFMQFLAILRKISPTSQTQMGNLDKAGDGGWEGVTKNEHMLKLRKEIWHYLLNHNMSITAEHLPSVLNTVVDRKSRKKNIFFKVDSSSQSFSSHFSTTRLSDNRSICFLPMPSPTSIYSLASRSLQSVDRCNHTKLEHGSFLCISPFSMISRVLLKITQECVPLLILIAPVWSTQLWFPELLKLCKGTSTVAPGKRNSDKAKKYCPLNDG